MQPKLVRQWVFTALLASFAAALLWAVAEERWAPPPLAIAGYLALSLLVWRLGFPTRYFGLLSLERVPQVACLLVYGPVPGALVCAIASLVWPFTDRAYRQGSLHIAVLRGLNNAAMTSLMCLAGGWAFIALGGAFPLAALPLDAVLPLAALALAMQAVNIAVMASWFQLEGRDVRRVMTPTYALIDLVFVPLGVLTALLQVQLDLTEFLLYLGLLLAFAGSFHQVARSRSALESRIDALDKAAAAGRALSGAARIDELAGRLRRQLGALFRYDELYLVLVDEPSHDLDVRVHEREGQLLPQRRIPAGKGLFGHIAATGKPLLVGDWTAAPADVRAVAVPTSFDPRSVMVVPLLHGGRTLGLISVQHRDARAWSDADLNLMSAIADQVAPSVADARLFEELSLGRERLEQRVVERTAALEAASAERERLLSELRQKSRALERQTREDPLTGLANRRHLDERLADEVARATRYGHAVTVALADLDRFKQVNDRFGHAIGDEVLRIAAVLLKRHCRGIDELARWGGEEFALVFPETDAVGARIACEKIRQAFAQHPWEELAEGLHLTISIGLFTAQPGMDASGVLERADANLYEAKRSGRDRVVG